MKFKRNLCAALVLSCIAQLGFAQTNTSPTSAQHPLLYTHAEMLQFDIEGYLQSHAPHLLPYAETISHWSGYTTVSPKVLLALIEQQSSLISKAPATSALKAGGSNSMARPFGALSQAQGFADQVQDVADQLANIMYAPEKSVEAAEFASKPTSSPLQALFANANANGLQAAPDQAINDFSQTYQRLFGTQLNMSALKQAPSLAANNQKFLAGPAAGFLQFPFPAGATWHVGGAHTSTGSGNYPMSSLDMSLGGGWGSYQGNVWVTSSASGKFKRHSSCFAEIIHANGWSTTYYHLMNIRYNTGANINKNAGFANPANTTAQALCNGGHSTGPHEHWSLKSNGAYYHLNGVNVSGWNITAIGSSYDTNCSRFYFTKNGYKKCSGWMKN